MAVNNKRGDYFEAPHYLSASKNSYPSAQHTGNPPVDVGSDNYNSEADRITEQELVGYIMSVTENTAKAQPIIDPATNISGTITTSRDSVIVRGILRKQ